MNARSGRTRSAIVTEVICARTGAQLCKVAKNNNIPVVFTNMASPPIMSIWKNKLDKRTYFEATAQLLDSRKGNAFLIYGSEREAETAHRIFATYGVPLEQFPYIISPKGAILSSFARPVLSAQSAKGNSLAKGMIDGAQVVLVGGLLRTEHVFNTMKDILLIAAGMGRTPNDFSVLTPSLITRDALEICPADSHRDWENPEGH